MNSALWELLLSTVLVLEIPALISSAILGIGAMRMRRRPKSRWVWMAMTVGLTVPWAGAAIGLIFGLLLSLAFSEFWVPLIAGTSIGVLYLQIRWTTLILTEWKEPKYIPESTNKRDANADNKAELANEQDLPSDTLSAQTESQHPPTESPSDKPKETDHQTSNESNSDEKPDESPSPT